MEEKILELKKELDSILKNYAVDKVLSDTGGSRRASKSILTRDIYKKIINFAIAESEGDFATVSSVGLIFFIIELAMSESPVSHPIPIRNK